MNINGKITILIDREQTHIELKDEDSGITFARITLTPKELSSALSRLAYTPCKMEVHGLDKLGKIQEIKTLEFQLPREHMRSTDHDELCDIAQKILDEENEGWQAENYFASQNTFFYKEEVHLPYARCTCRRWIDKK
jgi:hypothetical protein